MLEAEGLTLDRMSLCLTSIISMSPSVIWSTMGTIPEVGRGTRDRRRTRRRVRRVQRSILTAHKGSGQIGTSIVCEASMFWYFVR